MEERSTFIDPKEESAKIDQNEKENPKSLSGISNSIDSFQMKSLSLDKNRSEGIKNPTIDRTSIKEDKSTSSTGIIETITNGAIIDGEKRSEFGYIN